MTLRMTQFRPHGTVSKAGIMSSPLPGQGRRVNVAASSSANEPTPGQILRGHGPDGWKGAGWEWDEGLVQKLRRWLQGQDAPPPLNKNLGRLLQAYGELSQATYDNLGLDKCAPDWGYATKPPGQLLSYLTKDYPLDPAAPAAQYPGTADLYMLPSAAADSTLSPIINALPGSAPDGAPPKLVHLSLGELVWDTVLSKVFAFTAGLLIGAIDYGNGARTLFVPNPNTGRGKEERGAFMGYVAVSKTAGASSEEEVDVVIVWRGTIFKEEWQNNFAQDELAAWQPEPKDKQKKLDEYDKKDSTSALKEPGQDSKYKDVFVHQGFDDLYNRRIKQPGGQLCSPREVVREWLLQLMQQYNVTTVTTTGHSLGGGLATICAFGSAELLDRKWDEWQKLGLKTKAKPKVTLVSFAGPRVGNYSFGAKYRELGGRALRIANKFDIVPRVPGIWVQALAGTVGLLNHRIMTDSDYWLTRGLTWGYDKLANALSFIWPSRWGYFHVGQMLEVDSGDLEHQQLVSPKTSRHNLELYIHMVSRKAGCSERNPLLLNKSDDLLVDKAIPANWWGGPNKRGCTLDSQGRWKWNKPSTAPTTAIHAGKDTSS